MQSTLLAMAKPKLLIGNSVLCSISYIAVFSCFGRFNVFAYTKPVGYVRMGNQMRSLHIHDKY